jgi:hypothetical protein
MAFEGIKYLYSSKYQVCVSLDSLSKLNASFIQGEGIAMFPNPVCDFFTIQSANAGIFDLSIFDAEGQPVDHHDFLALRESNYSWRVNCAGLPNGVYLAIMKLDNRDVHCLRFMKSGRSGDDR